MSRLSATSWRRVPAITGMRAATPWVCWRLEMAPEFSVYATTRPYVTASPTEVQSFILPPPRSFTHEGLAYAPCPICRQEYYMHDMLPHLTSAHKELQHDLCRQACEERMAQYERVIGVPLERNADGGLRSGRLTDELSLLPTVSANGYTCNWCVHRKQPFTTRDAFLKHVIYEHPQLDVDLLELHIGYPPTAAKASVSKSPGRRLQLPTRRLADVKAVTSETALTPERPGTPRQVGVSVPRTIDLGRFCRGAVPNSAASEEFSATNFPCELCNRVFTTETNLLQHYEGRHPDGAAATGSTGIDADMARYMKKEAASSPGGNASPGQVYVMCDLCQTSKVYTLPSALFAHLRFKHSTEDAVHHVERLIAFYKTSPLSVCPHCQRGFATEAALNGHILDKHTGFGSARVAGSVTTSPGQQLVSPKNRWWCNECEKGFSQARGLHGHMVSKHRLQSDSFPCPACKRIFPDVHSLDDHFTVAHPAVSLKELGIETHVKCTECDRLFLTHEQLHEHCVKHHKKDPRLPVRKFDASPVVPAAKLTFTDDPPAAGAVGVVQPQLASSISPRKVQRRSKQEQV